MGNLLLNNNAISAKLGTKDVKLYMGELLIPQKYSKIEYIESTGQQIIATTDVYGEWDSTRDYGFYNEGSTYKIEIKYYVEQSGQVEQATLMAINEDHGPTIFHNLNNPLGMCWKFPSTSLTYFENVSPTPLSNRMIRLSWFGNIAESTVEWRCIKNNPEYDAYGIALFGRVMPNILDTDRKIKARLYYCKIYKDDVLLMDFIPVKTSDGEAGLFDKVNNKFIKSYEGTPFIAGPEI